MSQHCAHFNTTCWLFMFEGNHFGGCKWLVYAFAENFVLLMAAGRAFFIIILIFSVCFFFSEIVVGNGVYGCVWSVVYAFLMDWVEWFYEIPNDFSWTSALFVDRTAEVLEWTENVLKLRIFATRFIFERFDRKFTRFLMPYLVRKIFFDVENK